MTLTDPREALADQSDFISYLVGLAELGQVVHTLAAGGEDQGEHLRNPDDFVHVLLGLASIGAMIERFANSAVVQQVPSETPPPKASTTRWLR